MMEFYFVCPETQRIFTSDQFHIIEDRGVRTTVSGRKIWDAKAELLTPCPFCGKIHIFTVDELVCPFS